MTLLVLCFTVRAKELNKIKIARSDKITKKIGENKSFLLDVKVTFFQREDLGSLSCR